MTDDQPSESVMRPLHVLSVSPPHLNGYSMRTHNILKTQMELGLKPRGITSPYYPLPCLNERKAYQLDGIYYHRVPNKKFIQSSTDTKGLSTGETHTNVYPKRGLKKLASQLHTAVMSIPQARSYFYPQIVRLARKHRADLIHAHTPFRNAWPAYWAAKKLGLPFVYEMRGLWEDTAVLSGKFTESSPIYKTFKRMETEILKRADAVICISEALAADVAERGIDDKKIFVCSNAVDMKSIEQQVENEELKREIEGKLNRLKDTTVFGYVGSLRDLEGIDFLVEGFSRICKVRPQDRLLIVGGGDENYIRKLKRRAEELGMKKEIVFQGPVENTSIGVAYNLIDVLAITRRNFRVTSLVTPLKPYEAMAHGKVVLLPSLPAMSEIVEDNQTGRIFECGNLVDFAEKALLLAEPEIRSAMGLKAREYVRRNKLWQHSVAKTSEAYCFARVMAENRTI